MQWRTKQRDIVRELRAYTSGIPGGEDGDPRENSLSKQPGEGESKPRSMKLSLEGEVKKRGGRFRGKERRTWVGDPSKQGPIPESIIGGGRGGARRAAKKISRLASTCDTYGSFSVKRKNFQKKLLGTKKKKRAIVVPKLSKTTQDGHAQRSYGWRTYHQPGGGSCNSQKKKTPRTEA